MLFDNRVGEQFIIGNMEHINNLKWKILTLKAPNTTIAEFANTVDPDETAHNEPSRPDLQCLHCSL